MKPRRNLPRHPLTYSTPSSLQPALHRSSSLPPPIAATDSADSTRAIRARAAARAHGRDSPCATAWRRSGAGLEHARDADGQCTARCASGAQLLTTSRCLKPSMSLPLSPLPRGQLGVTALPAAPSAPPQWMWSSTAEMAQRGWLVRSDLPPRAASGDRDLRHGAQVGPSAKDHRTRGERGKSHRAAVDAGPRLPALRRRDFLAGPSSLAGRTRPARTRATHSPGSRSNLHPADYASNINFNKCLDFVRFCDLSRTSPTGFRTQTLLTEFGLTCHARRVRAHRRVALASIGFVRITCPRSPPRHDQLTPFACVGWTRMASLEDTSSLARSTRRRPLSTRSSARAERRADPTKTLTEDVRWLLRGSISKKADGGCTSSSSGRSSRSA
jgi:hypothetical protein